MSAEYIRNIEGHSNSATRQKPVANGVTVTDGDFVYNAGGSWSNASISGKRLAGIVVGGDAKNLIRPYSGLATVGDGTKEVLVAIEKDAEYLVKVGGTGAPATLPATDEGSYFMLVQGTGAAQVVDYATKSATTGQLRLLKANPGIRGTDATYGLFAISLQERLA